MYGNGGIITGTAAAGGALAFTGLSLVWIVLAAFAILAATIAVVRTVPRNEA